MFQRQVRFQVDISTISKQPNELFAITFTLLSGKHVDLAFPNTDTLEPPRIRPTIPEIDL